MTPREIKARISKLQLRNSLLSLDIAHIEEKREELTRQEQRYRLQLAENTVRLDELQQLQEAKTADL